MESQKVRTPRGTLNAQRILETAIDIIDRDGVEGLTIARLASNLGVTPMSMYTHFRDKDAILRAAAGLLFQRLEIPERQPGGNEIDYVKEVMRAYYRLLIQNPILLRLDATWEGIPDSEANLFEELYESMSRLGLAPRDAIGTVATYVRYVNGSAHVHQHRHQRDEDEEYWVRYRVHLAALPARRFPAMHALSAGFVEFDQEETFEYGLQLLVESLRRAPTR